MSKNIYVIKEFDFDPWTSHGYNAVKTKKELKAWLKDGSIKSGDIIYKATPYLLKTEKGTELL